MFTYEWSKACTLDLMGTFVPLCKSGLPDSLDMIGKVQWRDWGNVQRKNFSETRIYCQWVCYLRKKDDLVESNGENPDTLEQSMSSENWIVELVTTAMQCFSFEDKKKHMTTHVTPNLQWKKLR